MRTTDIEMMLETYDQAENKRQAITALAKMLKVDPDVIKEKLQQNGRKIDFANVKTKPTKATETKAYVIDKNQMPTSENIVRADESQAAALPMPEYVRDILFGKVGELETTIDRLQDELKEAQEHYAVLRDYLKL